ncbi:MAG: hypothetical protein LLF98_01865 [Clostridium sp.]|uniref:hypothetical protein n=1 Tax=Clostridium sp. TaxID=1506 RepID=UPI0025C281E3|nr:hypothetical protein [Clostridium sp.]MCE5220027.1 hypothetical protein [Clostridium sp.]
MDFSLTNDVSKADFWISYPDKESSVKDFIIPNKMYKLIKHEDGFGEEDYFIEAEDGSLNMYYLCHRGFFLIVKES